MAPLSCSSGRPVPAVGKAPLFQRVLAAGNCGGERKYLFQLLLLAARRRFQTEWGEVTLPSTFRVAVPPIFARAFPLRATHLHVPRSKEGMSPFFCRFDRPMPIARKALFSWKVLVADDHEERRYLPRHSRRLLGPKSQIFIERGKPHSLHLGGWLPLFSRFFCFYMLLIPLSHTPL